MFQSTRWILRLLCGAHNTSFFLVSYTCIPTIRTHGLLQVCSVIVADFECEAHSDAWRYSVCVGVCVCGCGYIICEVLPWIGHACGCAGPATLHCLGWAPSEGGLSPAHKSCQQQIRRECLVMITTQTQTRFPFFIYFFCPGLAGTLIQYSGGNPADRVCTPAPSHPPSPFMRRVEQRLLSSSMTASLAPRLSNTVLISGPGM